MRLKAPKYEKLSPFEQGYRAYNERYGSIDNPYESETPRHDQWYDGWLKANRDDGN